MTGRRDLVPFLLYKPSQLCLEGCVELLERILEPIGDNFGLLEIKDVAKRVGEVPDLHKIMLSHPANVGYLSRCRQLVFLCEIFEIQKQNQWHLLQVAAIFQALADELLETLKLNSCSDFRNRLVVITLLGLVKMQVDMRNDQAQTVVTITPLSSY